MAVQVLKNCKIVFDAYDISGHSNKIEIKYGAESQDATTFGSSFKRRKPGSRNAEISGEGFWEADNLNPKIDDLVSANLGIDKLFTICPKEGMPGERAFLIPGKLVEYQMGGEIGTLLSFSITGDGDYLARGTVLENGLKSATASGTAWELGQVESNQKIYAGLHVFEVEGDLPTFDLVIQSDTAQIFSSPLDRVVFPRMTGPGSCWVAIEGPIADTWWRASWVIGGTATEFKIMVTLAIQ